MLQVSLTEVIPEGSSLPSKGIAEKLPSAASDNYKWPYIVEKKKKNFHMLGGLCTTLAIIYNSAVKRTSNYELHEL